MTETGRTYPSLGDFLANVQRHPLTGPIAAIFVEDTVEIDTTLRHHLQCGFETVLAFIPENFLLSPDVARQVCRITYDPLGDQAVQNAVNRLIDATPDQWLYYCFNAEYLFYPFCESRSIKEMLTFHSEERRDSMLTYVIDLYAGDLMSCPSAVSLEGAHLDKSGYYALARTNPATGKPRDRQLDFYGGLRWRFEEHVPANKRRIDRIGLFKTRPGLTLQPDHTLNVEEYNTYACPWHNNLTAAICSFRAAKALKRNPGSSFDISTFNWRNSTPFEWHSRQLLELGLIEPGQWF